MSGFLDEMARLSAARAAQAKAAKPFAALESLAKAAPRGSRLVLRTEGFDVIAELKLMSPAAGRLGTHEDWLKRVIAYAQGGAAAVSVLTEPSRFDGSLEHLRQASAALAPFKVPTMRKDFLVDPYQVLEARAAGAGGVLLIVRMLSRSQMLQLLDAAAELGLFVLLEAFDLGDLHAARELLAARIARRAGVVDEILVGINSRDLQTLEVVPERFELLAPHLPRDRPAVAESGVASAADAVRMKRLGFRLALIGTALMNHDDPQQLLREILATTRTVKG